MDKQRDEDKLYTQAINGGVLWFKCDNCLPKQDLEFKNSGPYPPEFFDSDVIDSPVPDYYTFFSSGDGEWPEKCCSHTFAKYYKELQHHLTISTQIEEAKKVLTELRRNSQYSSFCEQLPKGCLNYFTKMWESEQKRRMCGADISSSSSDSETCPDQAVKE